MGKFNKRRAVFISDDTDSIVATTVSTSSGEIVNAEVVMTDCNRKICWHEFGSNEKEHLKKIDKVIKQFSIFREDVIKAYEVSRNA